jgi:thymidylate synthase
MTTQYLRLLLDIKAQGVFKGDRTGTGTQSLFGAQSRYDLRQGFPLLTTKKMFTRGIFEELLWMIRGSTDVRELQDRNVRIWDEWADDDGQLGPVYGAQWRRWNGHRDQLAELIQRIKDKPDDRRLIVTAWNPDDVEKMALPSCHCFFQCWTRELTLPERRTLGRVSHEMLDECDVPRRGLSLQLYQRSCDVFLGVPFNIASYALLTHMLAQCVGMVALDFVHVYGDVHIYNNHREQVDRQLTREPKKPPRLWLNPEIRDIDGFGIDDIRIDDYQCHSKIRAEVSV